MVETFTGIPEALRPSKSDRYRTSALDVSEVTDSPALANGYIGIGGALNDMGRAREALDAYAHAETLIAGKAVQPGTDAKIFAGYGKAWGKLGDANKRTDYYRRALAALNNADSAPLQKLRDKIAVEAAAK